MRFSHFFVDRPIFASVVSIVLVIVGLIAYGLLPAARGKGIAQEAVRAIPIR